MAMTPRQRWLSILDGQQPDRLPTDYWATSELHERLKCDLGCDDDEALFRKLHIDAPVRLEPHCLKPHHPDDPLADPWGVRTQRVDYGSGAYEEVSHHPLGRAQSADDIHAFRWPSPDDYDYTTITQAVEQADGYRAIRAGWYEPFLLYCSMRGMESAYEDLLIEPDIAHAALQHILDFHCEHIRRILEAGRGRIDIFYLAEDLGAQTGPLFSTDLYRRFLMPNQQKLAALAHQYGAHVFYHTDGAARPFLDDLVNHVGIDILNPLQWRCPGMELAGLVRDFGNRLVFHGGIDNQHTLPFGTPDDVREEVRQTARVFARHRWICAPCHNMQPNTPTENVVAMYETARRIS